MGSFGQGGRFEEVFINEKQSGLCVRQRTWYAAGTVFRRLPALFLRFRVLSSKKPILFEKKHSGLLQKINGTVGCYLDDGICYWENRQAKMSVIYWTMYQLPIFRTSWVLSSLFMKSLEYIPYILFNFPQSML